MTGHQRRFCEEYLVDLCAARAAQRAGYSKRTASQASRWIHPEHPEKPELREQIEYKLAERALRTQVSADRVVVELARIAFDGEAGAAGEAAEAANPEAGAGGEPPKRGRRRSGAADGVRTQDRLRALELLGRHLGMFTEGVRAEQVQPVIVDDVGGEVAAGGADGPDGADGIEGRSGDA